jgi:beta-glucosidase
VTNTGGVAGTQVVPVFVHQPTSAVLVPPHRLVGFTRVTLEPTESRTISLEFALARVAVTPGDIDSAAPPAVARGVYTVEVPTRAEPNDLFPSSSPPLRADFKVS